MLVQIIIESFCSSANLRENHSSWNPHLTDDLVGMHPKSCCSAVGVVQLRKAFVVNLIINFSTLHRLNVEPILHSITSKKWPKTRPRRSLSENDRIESGALGDELNVTFLERKVSPQARTSEAPLKQ